MLAESATARPGASITVDGRRRTLADLHRDVGRCAGALRALGLGHGTPVVLNADGSLELVAAYLAVLQAGLTAVLTNPAYTEAELVATVRRSGAGLVVSERTAPGGLGVRWMGLDELTREASGYEHQPSVALRPVRSDDVALPAFTSGTTGQPKGVPLTHAHLLASIRSAMWSWRWSDSDVLVHALPLFHQHGLSGLHASLVAGSSASIMSRFDPEERLATIERDAGTVLFGVPAIYRRLLDLEAERLQPLRRLRLATSGSGPLPVTLAERFREVTGVSLLERYGLTETGLDVSNVYDGARVPGTVGVALPGAEVDLRDADGRSMAGGEGEIVLRGPQVFDGYLDDAEATAQAFWPEGWFRTGDLGRWDAGGRLQVTGRLKDLVITGGMNVSPTEVEAVVHQLPEVLDAAVAGLPSERWGEEVAVWVVREPGAPVHAERIIEHCRAQLAPYKCPKQVFVIEAIPRNAIGKIMRNQLCASTGRPA
jgi:malonyl-CoA/methylmalonyl-CoA synthetase